MNLKQASGIVIIVGVVLYVVAMFVSPRLYQEPDISQRVSIIEPGSYVVSGYRDIMYPDYSSHFTEQDIQDLIAYLLTL